MGFSPGIMGGMRPVGGPARRAPNFDGPTAVRQPMPTPNPDPMRPRGPMASPMMFKKGGKVKKTGWAKVHKGETVVPAKKKVPKGKKARAKIKVTMDEWKKGKLRSGSRKGPKVKSQKQAVAIALSQARRKG